jgi:uracil phosphoribosyltransferase/phosphoserine phosphatase
MFWQEGEAGQTVYTKVDLDSYTDILYLDTPPDLVEQWRQHDQLRDRPAASADHLRKWQQVEKTKLRRLCRDNRILFCPVSSPARAAERIAAMVIDLKRHSEEHNLFCAQDRLDDILNSCGSREKLETVLVLDADRTLAAEDAGALFWKVVAESPSHGTRIGPTEDDRSLRTLFSSSLGYTYAAFRQATLLYEEEMDDDDFNAICDEVASCVTMHPEMVSLLKHVGEHEHVAAVVVTCGLRRVWDAVLAREGLSDVKVIGGGRLSDGFVVTPETKRALTTRLRDFHGLYVWAIGDSPMDLPMMYEAHQAIVVVGEEHARSKTMDGCLLGTTDTSNCSLRAFQVLLPSNSLPRLDVARLPLLELTDHEFLDSVVRRRHVNTRIVHATERKAAQLLMTPTRNATVAGPALRKAHSHIGRYLATEFLGDVIGIEQYGIPHVQGHFVSGFRVRHEDKTTIVAAMRGGEPMALGINKALPNAMFVHASQPGDVKPHHLEGQRTVLFVDSVVNNGKTVAEFVKRIRSLDPIICIVVVAGVVQAQSVSPTGILGWTLEHDKAVSVIALRLSENKFTGQGTTDTGNRLFNTTQLP